jgi:hypothetical protein
MKAQACPSTGSGRTEMSMDRGSGLVDRAWIEGQVLLSRKGLAIAEPQWEFD